MKVTIAEVLLPFFLFPFVFNYLLNGLLFEIFFFWLTLNTCRFFFFYLIEKHSFKITLEKKLQFGSVLF